MNEYRIYKNNEVTYVFADNFTEACKKASELVGGMDFDIEYVR